MTQGGWPGSGDAGRVRAQPAADLALPARSPRPRERPARREDRGCGCAGLRLPPPRPPRPSAAAGHPGKLLGPVRAGGRERRGGGVHRAGGSRARRGGEPRTEEPPPPPAARRGRRGGGCGGGGCGAGRCQRPRPCLPPANARLPHPPPSLPTCQVPRRPDPGPPLPPTLVLPEKGTSGHARPRGLAGAATCPCARLGARGRRRLPPQEQAPRRPGPVKARPPPRPAAPWPPHPPTPAPVPLGPERNHPVTPAQPGCREGARRPRGRRSPPADARGLGLGPAAPAQPGSYRGVTGRRRPRRSSCCLSAGGSAPARLPVPSRAGPARRPARRWPRVSGGRGSGQVPPPRPGAAPPSPQTVTVTSGSV